MKSLFDMQLHTVMVTQTYNPSNWEIEAGRSVQGHLLIHGEFEVSMGYVTTCLKNIYFWWERWLSN